MKSKSKIILIIIAVIVAVMAFVFLIISNVMKKPISQPITENYRLEEISKKTNSDSRKTKEAAYEDLENIVKNLYDVATVENMESIANKDKDWKDIIPANLHDSIYYFDTFSGEEYESLTWQTLLAISYVIKKSENDWDIISKEDRDIIFSAFPMDKDKGITIIPLSLMSQNLMGYNIDLFYKDGKWKPMIHHLITQMQMMETSMEDSE